MLILKDKNFVNDIKVFNNYGKISFEKGEELNFDPKAKYIVPGFIDQHTHGAGGSDFMDNSATSLDVITKTVLKEGTTSLLATTMTYDLAITKEVIARAQKYKSSGANIIGVHLEGPFISSKFIGAQNPVYLQTPNVEILKMLDPNKFVKIVTFAPEEDNNFELLKYLKEHNIIASAGHTGATCSCIEEAYKNGLKSITHFHNAMTPHTHREPGVVTAGFMLKDLNVEIIVDGIHLHPDVVKTTYNIKSGENITLVTDSMCAKGMDDGEYALGGQKVIKKGLEARLENGSLAGSVIQMNRAVQNMYNYSGCTLEEAFLMASYNQAKLLNLTSKGLLKDGYICDITVLDENFNVLQTFVAGKCLYSKND